MILSVVHGCPLSANWLSHMLLPVLGTVWPNMPCPHPLCLFSEVASRLSPSVLASHEFYRNFCSACDVIVVIFGHLNRSFYLLTYCRQLLQQCCSSCIPGFLKLIMQTPETSIYTHRHIYKWHVKYVIDKSHYVICKDKNCVYMHSCIYDLNKTTVTIPVLTWGAWRCLDIFSCILTNKAHIRNKLYKSCYW